MEYCTGWLTESKGWIMDWRELEHLDQLDIDNQLSPFGRENFAILLAETRNQDEHPENYEGLCECCLCMSYED